MSNEVKKGIAMKSCISMKWLVLWSLWLARVVRQPTLEVRVSSGLLRGSVAHDGSHIYYLGIPYATIVKRFQASGPEPTWDGVFEAVDEYVHCTQKWIAPPIISGQEDCLRINVFTPIDAPAVENLPVMVFIHGGGFMSGSGARFFYGPNYLVTKNVIYVTFNYRLHVLGQICLRTKDAPGNAGMKDQVAALRWVQRNIRAFGGDPNSVTIFGESAGGASVSYHILSPMSKGLFHKAIIQSGSALGSWAHQYNPMKTASLLAKTMGYTTEDPSELYRFFLSKTDKELAGTIIPRAEGNTYFSEVHFSPCVEKYLEGEEAFLAELPIKIFTDGSFNKVPLMKGVNDAEGIFFSSFESEETLVKMDFEKSMMKDLVFPSKEEKKLAAEIVRKLYMGDDKVSKATLSKFSRFMGEPFFNYPSADETELILKFSDQPIYSYFFDYNGWRNLVKHTLGRTVSAHGASHADDLFYLFSQPMLPSLFEAAMIERMTTLWTNFAKYGDPTPSGSQLELKWLPTRRGNLTELVLSSLRTQPLWHSHTLLYWKELYRKYRRRSFD